MPPSALQIKRAEAVELREQRWFSFYIFTYTWLTVTHTDGSEDCIEARWQSDIRVFQEHDKQSSSDQRSTSTTSDFCIAASINWAERRLVHPSTWHDEDEEEDEEDEEEEDDSSTGATGFNRHPPLSNLQTSLWLDFSPSLHLSA